MAVVKRLLPRKTKIGHTGTLDPLASGLLVLVIGRATCLSRYVPGLDKTYAAPARFGAISDSLDADGEITALNTPIPTEDDINAAIPNFVGDIEQIPPMASAIKIGGERLYAMHRRGEEIPRPARPVTIHEFQLSNIDPANYTAT
ncbi:MAG: tRNA pseudouridine(55) synthase TruB, partial [Rubrobacteraceae bacterium]